MISALSSVVDNELQPVEVAMVYVIRYMCCRELHEIPDNLEQHHLRCMCFLTELLDKKQRSSIVDVNEFEAAWIQCCDGELLGDDSRFVDATMDGILMLADNLDEFSSVGDVANELLMATSDSPPSAIEVDHIAPESLLGIFLRLVVLKAANLSFAGVVRAYEKFLVWCKQEVSWPQSWAGLPNATKQSSLQTAIKLFDNGFIHEAMDAAHKHFDYSATIQLVVADGGTSPTPVAHSNHETALLHHASMCIQSGQLDQGVMALEATIKLAQQRNKHDIVAVALLWLYHVLARISARDTVKQMPPWPSTSPLSLQHPSKASNTAQVVLTRCLRRATNLGLSEVVALATLALTKEVVSPCAGGEICSAVGSSVVAGLTPIRVGWALQGAADFGDPRLTASFVRACIGAEGKDEKSLNAKGTSKSLQPQGWQTLLPKSILVQQDTWITKGVALLAEASALCYIHLLPNSSVEEMIICAAKWARGMFTSGASLHHIASKLQQLKCCGASTHQRHLRDIALVQAEACFLSSLYSLRAADVVFTYLDAFTNLAESIAEESPSDLIRSRVYRAKYLVSFGEHNQEVLHLLAQTEQLADALRLGEWKIEVLLLRAEVYMQLNNHRAGLEQCRQAFETARQVPHPVGGMRCVIRMALVMLKLGKPANALQTIQAVYGCILTFGELTDKATASLALAVATRTLALQVYQIGERWRRAMLEAIVAARLAGASFAGIGNSVSAQEARDVEESLVQIYRNRCSLSAKGELSTPLRKLQPDTFVLSVFEDQPGYL